MLKNTAGKMKLCLLLVCLAASRSYAAADAEELKLKTAVDAVVQPLQAQYGIPGVAVAVTIDGKNYFYNYGVMSKETQEPVNSQTLFEIGSFSKTFAATFAAYAQINGNLSLTDKVSKNLPSLHGGSFDNISLLNLGTHTSGLPLYVPDDIKSDDQLLSYLKNWHPAQAAGTHRIYSNLGIGTLGLIAAKSMNESYDDAIEKKLFPELGLTHSYLHVPAEQMKNYAQGYTTKDVAIRLNPGMLASETYGVRTNSADLIRFVDENMGLVKLDGKLAGAISATHLAYFKSGEMSQSLIWEQYDYPTGMNTVVDGNNAIMDDTKVTQFNPPLAPKNNVLINKTGSTNGFSTYIAYIPGRKLGIVLLANKSYPLEARVSTAYKILTKLDEARR